MYLFTMHKSVPDISLLLYKVALMVKVVQQPFSKTMPPVPTVAWTMGIKPRMLSMLRSDTTPELICPLSLVLHKLYLFTKYRPDCTYFRYIYLYLVQYTTVVCTLYSISYTVLPSTVHTVRYVPSGQISRLTKPVVVVPP